MQLSIGSGPKWKWSAQLLLWSKSCADHFHLGPDPMLNCILAKPHLDCFLKPAVVGLPEKIGDVLLVCLAHCFQNIVTVFGAIWAGLSYNVERVLLCRILIHQKVNQLGFSLGIQAETSDGLPFVHPYVYQGFSTKHCTVFRQEARVRVFILMLIWSLPGI